MRSVHIAVLSFAVGTVLAACGGSDLPGERSDVSQSGGVWTELDTGRFNRRTGAAFVPFDGELMLFGGFEAGICPPDTDCVAGASPVDAVAIDLHTGARRELADTPTIGINGWVANDSSIFFWAACRQDDEGCSVEKAVARYTPSSDEWDLLPAPEGVTSHSTQLLWVGDELYSISRNDGPTVSSGDNRWDAAAGEWTKLPPLPTEIAAIKRVGADIGGSLVIFTSESAQLSEESAYRYDRLADRFVEWEVPGFQSCTTISAEDNTYFVPTLDRDEEPVLASGLLYDSARGEWRDLPNGPDGEQWNCGIVGVLEADVATHRGALGWVYREEDASWSRLEHPVFDNDRIPTIVVDGRVFVHGGFTWNDGLLSFGEPDPVFGGTWVWTPDE